jgi:hypothetical protein
VVDGFPTVAEFIQPEKSELKSENLMTRFQLWFANHVRTNQYFTQIVKYFDTACCSRPRSSYFSLILSRFLPPPVPIHQSEEKLKAPESRADQENHRLPSLLVLSFSSGTICYTVQQGRSSKYRLTSIARQFRKLLWSAFAKCVTFILLPKLCYKNTSFCMRQLFLHQL